jgi:hypothetical protein
MSDEITVYVAVSERTCSPAGCTRTAAAGLSRRASHTTTDT